jgi:hypothetical protein
MSTSYLLSAFCLHIPILYSNQIQLVPKMHKNSYRGRISFHASLSTRPSFFNAVCYGSAPWGSRLLILT